MNATNTKNTMPMKKYASTSKPVPSAKADAGNDRESGPRNGLVFLSLTKSTDLVAQCFCSRLYCS